MSSVCAVCFTIRTGNGACMCDAMGVTGPGYSDPAPVVMKVTQIPEWSAGVVRITVAPLPESAGGWHRRYAWHLESIPELLSLALAGVVPLAATRYGERVDSNGDPRRLPFNAGAMDDADLLWAMLAIYANDVVYRIGGSGPGILRESAWTVRDEAQGIRAAKAPETAAQDAAVVVRWLVTHCEVIGGTKDLHDAEELLFDLVRRMRVRYGVEERPTASRARVCAVCGTRGVVGSYANVAGREASLVKCVNCGAEGREAIGDEDEDADLLASGETSAEAPRDDQGLASSGDADGTR